MSTFLFVYGTLREGAGHPMHRLLAGRSTFIGEGRVRGTLVDFGPYPGLILPGRATDPDPRAPWVVGEVYRLVDPCSTLRDLDRYEGCLPDGGSSSGFVRVRVDVPLDVGGVVSAWAYVYRGPCGSGRIVPSGNHLQPGS